MIFGISGCIMDFNIKLEYEKGQYQHKCTGCRKFKTIGELWLTIALKG